MKKDQIQKFVLIALVAGGGVYCYFDYLLTPLAKREAAARSQIAKLEPLIKDAQSRIKRTRSIEASDPHAAAAGAIFDAMDHSIPSEAAVAWLPQRLTDRLKKHGIEKCVFRQVDEKPDTQLPRYKLSSWRVDVPAVDFNQLGSAIAALENEEGLMQFTQINIEATPLDPRLQRAAFSLRTLVKP